MGNPPLSARIPNPPAIFVGRRDELDWVRLALTRHPVAVICGLGGLGKSALAYAALRDMGIVGRPSARYVSLGRTPDDEDVGLTILRALASPEVDLGGAPVAEQTIDEALIDAAERKEHWVLIEDFHRANPERTARLLGRLSRYARKARFLFTSRRDPQVSELGGQVLALKGMVESDLRRVAERLVGADDPRVEAALRGAHGSVWRLRSALDTESTRRREHIFDALGPDASWWLSFLSHLRVAVDPDCLELPVDAGGLDELRARGIAVGPAGAVELHEVVSEDSSLQRAISLTTTEVLDVLIASLSKRSPRPAALLLEALRLAKEAGRIDSVQSFFDDRALQSVVRLGYGERLQALLQGKDPTLDGIRLRLALEANGSLAIELPDTQVSDPTVALSLARAAYQQHQFESALAFAHTARDRGKQGQRTAAQFLIASVYTMGRYPHDWAFRALSEIETGGDSSIALRRDAFRVFVEHQRAGVFDTDALSAVVERARQSDDMLVRSYVGMYAALTYRLRGALNASRRVMAELIGPEPIDSPSMTSADRYVHALDATFEVESGRLGRVDRFFADLIRTAPLGHWDELQFARVKSLHLRGRWEEAFAVLQPELARSRRGRAFGHLSYLAVEHAIHTGELPPAFDWPTVASEAPPQAAALCWYRLQEAILRRPSIRDEVEVREVDLGVRAAAPEVAYAAARAKALRAALSGDHVGARREANAAVRALRATDFTPLQVEALALTADLGVIDVGRDSLARAALRRDLDRIAEMLSNTDCTRLELELRFHRWVLEGCRLEELVCLFDEGNASPTTRRRTLALLGGPDPVDRLDALVVRNIESSGFVRGELRGNLERCPLLVVDRCRGFAYRGAMRFDLRRRRIPATLLTALIERGGEATRDQLVEYVWGESYHPLRHDNRLKLTVRELRRAFDSKDWIESTEEGYRIVAPVCVREANPSPVSLSTPMQPMSSRKGRDPRRSLS